MYVDFKILSRGSNGILLHPPRAKKKKNYDMEINVGVE
jgi:hypothetical protein